MHVKRGAMDRINEIIDAADFVAITADASIRLDAESDDEKR